MSLLDGAELVCDVVANPADRLAFHWTLANETLTGLAVSNGTRSVLRFSPRSEADYGAVLCFANNEVGRQREACTFNVKPAGKHKSLLRTSIGGHFLPPLARSLSPQGGSSGRFI